MKINFKKIGGVSLAILGSVFPAVKAVEDGVHAVKDAKGSQAKQDAAFELIKNAKELAIEVKDKSLLDNPKIAAATRVLIDAVVALQNVLHEEVPELVADGSPAPAATDASL